MKSNLTKLSLLGLIAALGVSTVWAQASGSASSGDGGQAPAVQQAQGLDAVAEPLEIPGENIDGSEPDDAIQTLVSKVIESFQEARKDDSSAAHKAALGSLTKIFDQDDKNLAVRTWLGYFRLKTGGYNQCLGVLKPALGKSTSDAVNKVNLQNSASAAYTMGDFALAAQHLNTLEKGEPTNPLYPRLLGSAYLMLEQAGDAVTALDRALAAEKNKASRSFGLTMRDKGIGHAMLGEPAKALAAFEAADKLGVVSKESGRILAWMGFSYLQAKKYDEAILRLEQARSSNADQTAVLNNLGNAYAGIGLLDKAVEAYEALAELNPNLVSPWYNIGSVYIRSNQFAKAIPALRKGLDVSVKAGLAPSTTRFLHNNLGYCLEKTGKNLESAAEYAKASDIDPKSQLFAKNAGMAWFRANSIERTRKYLERYKENGGTDLEVDKVLAELNVREGKNSAALVFLERIVKEEPNRSDLWFNIGVLKHRTGDFEGAEAAYRKSLDISPADPDATNNLGLLLYDQGKYSEALGFFEKMSSADPDSVLARVNLAAVLFKLNRVDESIEHWRWIVRTDPAQIDSRLSLADAYWMKGKSTEARHHYAVVLQTQPKNARALNGMGLWLLSQTKNKEAEEHFRKAIESEEKYMPPYNNLAITLEKLNRLAEAILILEKAIKIDPKFEDGKRTLKRLKSATI